MAKRNASTLAVMQVRNDPAQNPWQALELSSEDYSLLKKCASEIRPSECTERQRQIIKDRRFAEVIEYPSHFQGQRYVLTTSWKAILSAAQTLEDAGIKIEPKRGPASILQFPSKGMVAPNKPHYTPATTVTRTGRTSKPPNDAA
jgi:hypothetical protein